MSENIRVAIDGPSGAGKSTLARSVAARLNFLYVDTGAIYRTIGYAVWRKGIDPRDRSAVVAVLPDLEICLTGIFSGIFDGEPRRCERQTRKRKCQRHRVYICDE